MSTSEYLHTTPRSLKSAGLEIGGTARVQWCHDGEVVGRALWVNGSNHAMRLKPRIEQYLATGHPDRVIPLVSEELDQGYPVRPTENMGFQVSELPPGLLPAIAGMVTLGRNRGSRVLRDTSHFAIMLRELKQANPPDSIWCLGFRDEFGPSGQVFDDFASRVDGEQISLSVRNGLFRVALLDL